jgi:hypothetical protein
MGMKLVGEAGCCGQLPLHPHGGLMNWRRLAGSVCDNKTTSAPPIQLKTLLNKVHRLKSFVYHSQGKRILFCEDLLEVFVVPSCAFYSAFDSSAVCGLPTNQVHR